MTMKYKAGKFVAYVLMASAGRLSFMHVGGTIAL